MLPHSVIYSRIRAAKEICLFFDADVCAGSDLEIELCPCLAGTRGFFSCARIPLTEVANHRVLAFATAAAVVVAGACAVRHGAVRRAALGVLPLLVKPVSG